MLVLLLFTLMLSFMLMRVYLPFGAKATGKPAASVYLSLREKALMQRTNIYTISGVLLLMALTQIMPATGEIVIAVVAVGILSLPVRCQLTSEGVALSNVVFRPWNDFAGFRIESRRIVLVGKEGNRQLVLPLLASHQKDVLPVLRRHLSEAKSGRVASGRRRQATS